MSESMSRPPDADSATPKAAPRALCPVCGRLPENLRSSVVYTDEQCVTHAFHLCQRGHLWEVRWAEEVPA